MVKGHEDTIRQLAHQFSPVFENSPDGVYIWLDDDNKVCNEKLAKMFGYTVSEWRATQSFLDSFVDDEDQHTFGSNYQMCVAPLAFPATFRFRGRCKDGSTFSAEPT